MLGSSICTCMRVPYFVSFLMYLSSFHGVLSITYLVQVENSMTRIRRCRSHNLEGLCSLLGAVLAADPWGS